MMFRDLIGRFDRLLVGMPVWVRIAAIGLIALMLIWILVSPRLIVGDVVTQAPDGSKLPYRGVRMQTQILGYTHKIQVNEEGIWAMPLASAFPSSISMRIYLNETGTSFKEFSLDTTYLWIYDFVRIEIDRTSLEPRVSFSALDRGLPALIVATAVAQPAPGGGASDDATMDAAAVRARIADAFAKAGVRPVEGSAPPVYPLKGENAPPYMKKLEVIRNVEAAFALRIPDEHWQTFSNSAQAEAYVAARLATIRIDPALRGEKDLFSINRSLQALPPPAALRLPDLRF